MSADRDQEPSVDSGSLTGLRGVGPALASRLSRLGVHRVDDLLFVLPSRYEDRTRISPMGSLRPGDRVVVEGEIQLTEVIYRGRRNLVSRIADGTGSITLRLFHFSRQQEAGLARGSKVRCYGEARPGVKGIEMVHPEYRVLRPDRDLPLEDRLTPIYPTTEGITQGRIRSLVVLALERSKREGLRIELMPPETLEGARFPSLIDALEYVHRPPLDADLAELTARKHPAQRRLAFEELLAHHISLRRLREAKRHEPADALERGREVRTAFEASLPFALTGAQARVIAEIDADLDRATPMMRLVQGDVGSGKTVIAASALLRAVASNAQGALMAPTELLAEQHMVNLCAWLDPLGIEVAFLSGRLSAKQRREVTARINTGEAQVVVGTHALFQEEVTFHHLAMVVVDEQHRFGVHQRLALREKGRDGEHLPHQLIMTATPIPRTLAQTAYADLDVSVVDELPPGRTPVATVALPETRRAEIVERIAHACAQGRQAYWVCPLVEESEQLEAQAAEETAAALEQALPDIEVGLVHGRMKPKTKDEIMRRFKDGAVQLLVATTVIEVGVDVPGASLMVVENAERMGLAQLHQLRGRVGRGETDSSCVLLYRAPLSEHAKARLNAMRETHSGFEIADRDLELRGPGELLGTRQTGLMQLRVADIVRDSDLLPRVHRFAEALLAEHPDRVDALVERWVGAAAAYADV